MSNDDLIRALNDYYLLFQKKEISDLLEQKIKQDIKILNDNKDIESNWLHYKYGITLETGEDNSFSKIKSYKNGIIEIDGSKSTKFKISDFSGTHLLPDGSLKLKTGQIVNGEIIKNDDGSIHIKTGSNGYYQDNDGKRTIIPSKDSSIDILITDKDTIIKGDFSVYSLIGDNLQNENQKIIEISGQITIYPERNSITIGEKTQFTRFEEDNKKYSIHTEKGLEYNLYNGPLNMIEKMTYSKKYSSKDISSMSEDSNGNIKVYANGKNNLDIEIFKYTDGNSLVKVFRADAILDESSINLKYSGSSAIFTKDSFNLKGNPSDWQGLGLVRTQILENEVSIQQLTSFPSGVDETGKILPKGFTDISNEAIVARKLIKELDHEKYVPILIGSGKYDNEGFPNLAGTKNDVDAFKEFLVGSGFDQNNIKILDSPTRKELTDALDEISRNNPDKKVVFYFSGHGFNQGSTFYFATSNSDPKNPEQTGLSSDSLTRKLPKGSVIVADACFSGCLLYNSNIKQDYKVIASTGSTPAYESDSKSKPMGYFTRYLTQDINPQNLPAIDRVIQNFDKLQGNLKPKGWQTRYDVRASKNAFQQPIISGFAIENSQETNRYFIVSSNLKTPIFLYQD